MLSVTPMYTAIIVVLMGVLSTRVAVLRGVLGVSFCDGGKARLFFAQRQFGNLAEYAAAGLLVLLILDLQGAPSGWLHAYGIAFVALRLVHPLVLFDTDTPKLWQAVGRFVAAAGTVLLMAAGAIAAVFV